MTTLSKQRQCFGFAVLFLLLAFPIARSGAQLIPLNAFNGAATESFESFTVGFTNPPLSIFGGAATLQSTNYVGINRPGVFNFLLGDSSQNAPFQCVVPADGQNSLGIESGLGVASLDITFTNTVKAFGGFWGATAETNAPATLTFTFFDAGDQEIGAAQTVSYVRLNGDGMLEWHGWFSLTPFKHVRIVSSDSTLVADGLKAGTAAGFSLFTSITPLTGGKYELQGNGMTGVVYSVQVNTNLSTTNWTSIGSVQCNASGTLQFTNTSSAPRLFYRLQAP